MKEKRAAPLYVAFDLLVIEGEDLRDRPLLERKERLAKLLAGSRGRGSVRRGSVRLSNHVLGGDARLFEKACRAGLEGIVSKRSDSAYVAGRGRDWCKSKCGRRQEFVIAGFTDPEGARRGIGALVLGVHENGRLIPAGRVGAGFDDATLARLHHELAPLEVDDSPFSVKSPRSAGVHWVRPKKVAEVQFTEWTEDGLLRHPVFVGLREDKPARKIVRERAAARPRSTTPRTDASDAVLGVTITHPDRLVIAESKVTKLALARHFEAVAERMEPFVFERPIALLRCVQGARGACFFQMHLDPAPDVPWRRVVEAAEHVRLLLQELELESFVMTTGGKGLHVVAPIAPRHTWDVVKPFTAAIAPWSPRARPGAPVATPVAWEELARVSRCAPTCSRGSASRQTPESSAEPAARCCVRAPR